MPECDEVRRHVWNAALRSLAMREHCAVELRTKLEQKGYDSTIVDEVIALLLEKGLLSEQRFAESFMRMRLQRGDTPWLAATRMRAKGCAEDVVDAQLKFAVSTFPAADACVEIVHKRDPDGLRFADKKVWNRVMRYLIQKGFAYATAQNALQERGEPTE